MKTSLHGFRYSCEEDGVPLKPPEIKTGRLLCTLEYSEEDICLPSLITKVRRAISLLYVFSVGPHQHISSSEKFSAAPIWEFNSVAPLIPPPPPHPPPAGIHPNLQNNWMIIPIYMCTSTVCMNDHTLKGHGHEILLPLILFRCPCMVFRYRGVIPYCLWARSQCLMTFVLF